MAFEVLAVRYFTHGETQDVVATCETEDEARAEEHKRTQAVLQNGYMLAESEVTTPVYLVRAGADQADEPERPKRKRQ